MFKATRRIVTILGLIVAIGAFQATSALGLTLSSEIAQPKILRGGDGQVAVALNLWAPQVPEKKILPLAATDLVIVLDRSGSMEGQKLSDARRAVAGLIERLGPRDRLALVSYANGVQTNFPLTPVTTGNRRQMVSLAMNIIAGGGTNLGGGLQLGIDLMLSTPGEGRNRKLILISDGLANQGITDPIALGRMASIAVENRFSVSTVGVGLDFNETLMTAIADHGAGSYHFMENPVAFARIFEEELHASRQVVVADLRILIHLAPGVMLSDAAGYPIHYENGEAIVYPGDLFSGQKRTFFLTFTAPTDALGTISIGTIATHYQFEGAPRHTPMPRPLTVTCVTDPAEAMASIDKKTWGDQVVRNEFSRLREEVAGEIRKGNKAGAQARIREYETKQRAINRMVESEAVTKNLDTDVQALQGQVEETFAGPAAAVAQKQKQASKAIQYESYKVKRDKQ